MGAPISIVGLFYGILNLRVMSPRRSKHFIVLAGGHFKFPVGRSVEIRKDIYSPRTHLAAVLIVCSPPYRRRSGRGAGKDAGAFSSELLKEVVKHHLVGDDGGGGEEERRTLAEAPASFFPGSRRSLAAALESGLAQRQRRGYCAKEKTTVKIANCANNLFS